MYTHPQIDRTTLTPRKALDILLEGNDRFVNNRSANREHSSIVNITKLDQRPFASFLSCSDSRAPVELLFDQALGDIFSVRLAGNIASDKAIGSLEFSTKYLGSKLIVVMGHTSCGAVKAACDDFKDGHIGEIINLIKPSIRHEKTVTDTTARNSKNPEFVEKINVLNLRYQLDSMVRMSDIVADMLDAHQIGIIGGIYDIATGKVHFLEDTLIL
jgi:carbonic anhydrase